MTITTILSDLGDVVVRYDEMKACRALFELRLFDKPSPTTDIIVTPEYLQEIVFGPRSFHGLYQRGRITWAQMIRLLQAACCTPSLGSGLSGSEIQPLVTAYNDVFEPIDEVIDLWKTCRSLGLTITALSDTEESRAWKLDEMGILDIFDHCVLSFEEGVTKPDGPELFIRALDRSGCKAEEALFVDDRQVCLDVADSLGIHTFKYELHNHMALERELMLLGVPLLSTSLP